MISSVYEMQSFVLYPLLCHVVSWYRDRMTGRFMSTGQRNGPIHSSHDRFRLSHQNQCPGGGSVEQDIQDALSQVAVKAIQLTVDQQEPGLGYNRAGNQEPLRLSF